MPVYRTPVAILALALASTIGARAQAAPTPAGAQEGVQTGAQTETQTETQPGTLPSSSTPLQPLGSASPYAIQPLVTTPTLSPGALALLELDGRLSQAVAGGGGKAFAGWFAPDAVTLNNGKPPVQGRANIAATATWAPADYQLAWSPQGASMGPSNDMGYTWGSYQGRARDANGQPVLTTGRYITIWRKQPDGDWKIALEASADDAPGAGACCKLPTP